MVHRDPDRPGARAVRSLPGLALVIAALLAVTGGAAASPRDGDLWRDRLTSLQTALDTAEHEERDEVLFQLEEFLDEALSHEDDRSAQLRAKEAGYLLAQQLDFDVDTRLGFLDLAREALMRTGPDGGAPADDVVAYNGFRQADLLYQAGRSAGAAERAREALEECPRALETRVFLKYVRAESLRQLGQYGDAVGLIDEVEPETRQWILHPAEPRRLPELHELLRQARLLRCFLNIDLGLFERAWGLLPHELLETDGGHDWTDRPRFMGHLLLLTHAIAVEDFSRASVLAERFRQQDHYRDDPSAAARLRKLQAMAHLFAAGEDPDRLATIDEEFVELLSSTALEAPDRMELLLLRADLLMRRHRLADAGRLLQEGKAMLDGTLDSPHREWGVLRMSSRWALLSARWNRLSAVDPEALHEARSVAESVLAVLLESWRGAPAQAEGIPFLHFWTRRELLSEILLLDRAIDGPEAGGRRALDRLAQVHGAGTLSRTIGADWTAGQDLWRELVPGEHGLLVYLASEPHTLLFVVDGQGVDLQRCASSQHLQDLRRAYQQQLKSGTPGQQHDRETERDLSRQLARALFPEEVARRIGTWRSMTVVGLDGLGPVPLASLLVNGRRLGTTLPLDSSPSLPVALALARRAPRTPAAACQRLVVTDPRPSAADQERWPGLQELTDSDAMRQALVGGLREEQYRWLAGPAATWEAVRHAGLGDVVVAQFFVHSVRDALRPQPRALLLTDGPVWCEDVAATAGPEFVVLLSCQSGAGQNRLGDPYSSDLAGAWLKAGSRAVLVSYADLEYGPVLETSRVLHRGLAAGLSPSTALMRALAERERAHPEEWPFQMGQVLIVGDGHRPPGR